MLCCTYNSVLVYGRRRVYMSTWFHIAGILCYRVMYDLCYTHAPCYFASDLCYTRVPCSFGDSLREFNKSESMTFEKDAEHKFGVGLSDSLRSVRNLECTVRTF